MTGTFLSGNPTANSALRVFPSLGIVRRHLALLFAIGLCMASGAQVASAAVGRTAGNFGVSASGAAQYSIPLWTPPGINGVQPSLALVYSSRGGDGFYGVGWGLSGLSSIHRCSKTWAQDGLDRDVRNDASDRFCLDGNQLKLTGGTYGVAGSTYQTEIETFSRVTAYGTAGNGPAYFIVEGKDGLKYEYGGTADSRIESVGQSTARTWALDQVYDRAGNAMLFTYTEDATNGSYRISAIEYTRNTAAGVASGHYLVNFVYETIPVGEVDSAYFAGSLVKRITRLDKIDISSDGTTVRRYDLTYEGTLSSTSKSRLASVQECGITLSDCLSATTFTYQSGTLGLNAEVNSSIQVPLAGNNNPWTIDVNGDGRKDLVYTSTDVSGTGVWMVALGNTTGGFNTPVNTGITNTNFAGATSIDYNTDGLEDLILPYSGGTWWVMLGTSTGLAAPFNTGIPVTTTGIGYLARAIDICAANHFMRAGMMA
jgi:hypothetical protein